MAEFSDWIVFADESGDHGLDKIDTQFPVFSLVFCAFEKDRYINELEPLTRSLKYRWFGHDAVVLHEREIRKSAPPFHFLQRSEDVREQFFAELNEMMDKAQFTCFASIIDRSNF